MEYLQYERFSSRPDHVEEEPLTTESPNERFYTFTIAD